MLYFLFKLAASADASFSRDIFVQIPFQKHREIPSEQQTMPISSDSIRIQETKCVGFY